MWSCSTSVYPVDERVLTMLLVELGPDNQEVER
jgi:hypothetical protein